MELLGDSSGDDEPAPAPSIQFVSVFHEDPACGPRGEDEDAATPVGFQNTPDEWHTAGHRQRGPRASVAGAGAATQADDDAATQRDSEATLPQSAATEVDPPGPPTTTTTGAAPFFVAAMGSLPELLLRPPPVAPTRLEDVDEEETQIMMTLSQDRLAMGLTRARQIEEEALQLSNDAAPGARSPKMADGEGADRPPCPSDAESDLSDDMLVQDGDINGISAFAASFQQLQSESLEEEADPKRPPAPVYKPRGPFQISPPASVRGVSDDESSGAETEVDEEPEPSPTESTGGHGNLNTSTEELGPPPPVLDVTVKQALGRRSVSESHINSQSAAPHRYSLDRAASTSDILHSSSPEKARRRVRLGSDDTRASESTELSPGRSRRRVKLGTEGKFGKPPRAPRSLANSMDENEVVRSQQPRSEKSIPARESDNQLEHIPPEATHGCPISNADISAASAPIPPKSSTPTNRKRKLISSDTPGEAEDGNAGAARSPDHTEQAIRVMFTGLDGTLKEFRDKVKQIAGATQEDDDVETVTHLIAPNDQLKRTVKLLCGISCCDHVVDERWLDESANAGVPVDAPRHCLKDVKAEAKWKFSLYNTMYDVPKHSRRKLFSGLAFFITNHKSVLPPVKELVRIVDCAGGTAEIKGPASSKAIVITTEAALGLASVKKTLAAADPTRLYTPEFILSGILQQRLDYDANRLTLENSPATKKKRARR